MKKWHGWSGLRAQLGNVSLIWLAVAAGGSLGGCSREQSNHDGFPQTGSIGLNLTAAPGVTLGSVTYSIEGNGFTRSGVIDTSGAPAVTGTIGGIPAGKGYTIALTATSGEGDTTFTGSARFDVTAGGTSAVTVRLTGTSRTGNGSVTVTGTVNIRPRIEAVTVTPLTVFVGSAIALSAVGSDADQGPSPLSYYWSTTGGVIDNPIASGAKLTSGTVGTFTITLTLSDGAATDTASTTVSFVKPPAGGEGAVPVTRVLAAPLAEVAVPPTPALPAARAVRWQANQTSC